MMTGTLAIGGCAGVHRVSTPHTSDLRGTDLSLSITDDPVTVWVRYRLFLQAVVEGGTCDVWQLEKAVWFFEAVTDIPSSLPLTGLGMVLDREVLAQVLSKWDKWFRDGNTIHLEKIPSVVFQLGEPAGSP